MVLKLRFAKLSMFYLLLHYRFRYHQPAQPLQVGGVYGELIKAVQTVFYRVYDHYCKW